MKEHPYQNNSWPQQLDLCHPLKDILNLIVQSPRYFHSGFLVPLLFESQDLNSITMSYSNVCSVVIITGVR